MYIVLSYTVWFTKPNVIRIIQERTRANSIFVYTPSWWSFIREQLRLHELFLFCFLVLCALLLLVRRSNFVCVCVYIYRIPFLFPSLFIFYSLFLLLSRLFLPFRSLILVLLAKLNNVLRFAPVCNKYDEWSTKMARNNFTESNFFCHLLSKRKKKRIA